ncbi:cobalamin-binding protein [Novipirellula caenicola]|uniref:Vitamin B12-binding protein n=1 Tax=Novipirellula caenicola TaxID=1536901 RepID=A0ABP9VPB4_9BACT
MTQNVIILSLLLAILGCHDHSPQRPAPPTGASVVVVDRLDRELRFEAIPRRIVSLSPSTTELLFAIGAGPQVVGATKHCNYPDAATEVPRVGAGTLESISRETILSLQPDLVLCKWDTHQPLVDPLTRLGIPVIAIGPENLQALFQEARLLGKVLGRESEADALVNSMTTRLDHVTSLVEQIPPRERRSVFYEVWDDPLMTAGPNSFIGELLTLGGMKNIFADTSVRYPKVSSEVVVHRNPEVILAPSTHADQVSVQQLLLRQGWSEIAAIREQQVFLIDGDQVSRCGPRLIDALEQMITAVYPDQVVMMKGSDL